MRIREIILSGRAGWLSALLIYFWVWIPAILGLQIVSQVHARRAQHELPIVPYAGDLQTFVRDDSGGWKWYDLDGASADGLTVVLAERPNEVIQGMVIHRRYLKGWVFNSVEEHHWSVQWRDMGQRTFRVAGSPAVRQAIIQHSAPPDAPAVALATGDVVDRRPIVGNLLWTAALILLVPLWMFATIRFPLMLLPVQIAKRRRRLKRGRCPSCGYDISVQQRAGIEVCPECGGSLVMPSVAAVRSVDASPAPTA